jgi:hypothetical protein
MGWIRIGMDPHSLKKFDPVPDPNKDNADPKHCSQGINYLHNYFQITVPALANALIFILVKNIGLVVCQYIVSDPKQNLCI